MENLYKGGMFEPAIEDILRARLQSLPELVMEASLACDIDELVARHLPAGRVAVIDDANSSDAYGNRVFAAVKGRFAASHVTLAGRVVKADEATLAEIDAKSQSADLLIAVGSGTINDLVKYASFRAGKPYLLIPTATSMNGYVSATASLSLHGHKQSLKAHLPVAVLMDMGVIAAAPPRLTRAGLGDSLARSTAQADWLLAHHLLGEPYDDTPYRLTAPYEAAAFEQAGAIAHGDRAALAALLRLLLLSGFGMTIAGSSRPASGSEHMIAHAYGMSVRDLPDNLHGEEIAVTTPDAAARQQRLLDSGRMPRMLPVTPGESMAPLFDAATLASFAPLLRQKHDAMSAAMVTQQQWDRARNAMAAIHLAPSRLEKIRKQAGLPEHPVTLGWDARRYAQIVDCARLTRDRFTCLDVA